MVFLPLSFFEDREQHSIISRIPNLPAPITSSGFRFVLLFSRIILQEPVLIPLVQASNLPLDSIRMRPVVFPWFFFFQSCDRVTALSLFFFSFCSAFQDRPERTIPRRSPPACHKPSSLASSVPSSFPSLLSSPFFPIVEEPTGTWETLGCRPFFLPARSRSFISTFW